MRGAKPSCVVKMSKTQARQTSVLYSVTLPGGKALRSNSRFFFAAGISNTLSADYADSTDTKRRVAVRFSLGSSKLLLVEICVICVIYGYSFLLHNRNKRRAQVLVCVPNRQIEFCLKVASCLVFILIAISFGQPLAAIQALMRFSECHVQFVPDKPR